MRCKRLIFLHVFLTRGIMRERREIFSQRLEGEGVCKKDGRTKTPTITKFTRPGQPAVDWHPV
jgi:hypothetical protein